MRLLRLRAHFGVLDGTEIEFTAALLKLVVDANESGKSTLVSAIVAALYGLLPGNRGARPEKDLYKPLTGNRFEVELDLEAQGRSLRIRRNFEAGTCTVRDTVTQADVTNEFAAGKNAWEPGRVLLGLTREQFLRSALVRQGEVNTLGLNAPAALTTRIQQLVDTNAGNHTADAAIRLLDGALRSYRGKTVESAQVSTEITRLQERIRQAEQTLARLQRERDAVDSDATELQGLRDEAARLRQVLQQERDAANRADAHSAAQRLTADAARRARRDELLAERGSLEKTPDLAEGLHARISAIDATVTGLEQRLAEAQAEMTRLAQTRLALEAALAGRSRFEGATRTVEEEALRLEEQLTQRQGALADVRASLSEAEAQTEPEDALLTSRFGTLPLHDAEMLATFETRRAMVEAVAVAAGSLAHEAGRNAALGALRDERSALGPTQQLVAESVEQLNTITGEISGLDRQLGSLLEEQVAATARVTQAERPLVGRTDSPTRVEILRRDAQHIQSELEQSLRQELAARQALETAEAGLQDGDEEVVARFQSLSSDERLLLERYHQDRAALLARLQGIAPSSSSTRGGGERRIAWAVGGAALAVVGAVVAALLSLPAGALILVAGAALAAVALLLPRRRQVLRPTAAQDVREELDRLEQQAVTAAAHFGYRSVDAAIGGLQQLAGARGRLEGLAAARRGRAQARGEVESARAAGLQALEQWGAPAPSTALMPAHLEALQTEVSEYLSAQQALVQLQEAVAAIHGRRRAVQRRRAEQIDAFTASCGMAAETVDDRQEAIARFRQAADANARRLAIDGRIAAVEQTLLPAGEAARLQQTIEAWCPGLAPDEAASRAKAEIEALRSAAGAIAARLGYDEAGTAAAALRDWRSRQPRLVELNRLRVDSAYREQDAATTADETAAILARWGVEMPAESVTPQVLASLRGDLADYMRTLSEYEQASVDEAAVGQRVAGLSIQREAEVSRFAAEAQSAAETPELRTAALRAIERAEHDWGRLGSIEEQLREVEAAMLSAEERDSLAVLAVDASAGTGSSAPAQEHRARAGELEQQLAGVDRQVQAIQRRLDPALAAYQTDYGGAMRELELSRGALARVQGFAAAAGLARDVLAEVAKDAHLDWSRRLNRSASDVLGRFGGEHVELSFSPSLEFVLRDRCDAHEWPRKDVDERLSAGARDQVYLAIRFALTEYFSIDGVPLPLILDDPLVTHDDARFSAVLGYLVEQSAERQVILLTCHDQRHRWWLQQNPQLAERVQLISLHHGAAVA